MDVRVGLLRKLRADEWMLLSCSVVEDSWESLGMHVDQTSWSKRKSVLNIHSEGLMLKLKLQYLATWCKELTHWKRPWCWETLKAREEGDDRGWDGWTASPTQWTWVWASSKSWWCMEAWHSVVPGITKSGTCLCDWTELIILWILIELYT